MQLSRLALSYSSGLLASLSPCVVVLLPLLLVRFMPKQQGAHNSNSSRLVSAGAQKEEKRGAFPLKDILLFLLGFQVSYLTFGLFVSSLMSSSIQNGIFLGMGSFFTVVGILGVFNALDPLQLPLFQKPFYFGLSFAMLISVNPCTVPFLAVIVSLSTADALLAMLLFGQGVLTPALVFIVLGSKFSQFMRSSGGFMHTFNRFVNVIVVLTGLYLSWSVRVVSFADLLVALGVKLAVYFFVMQRVQSFFEAQAFANLDEDDSWLADFMSDAAVKTPGKAEIQTKTVRVRLLALEIVSALFSLGAFLLGHHDEETHEALDMGTHMAAGAQEDEDTSSCVDLSQVPPCWRCSAAIGFFMLANLITCAYLASLYLGAKKEPSHEEEPASSPVSFSSRPPAETSSPLASPLPKRRRSSASAPKDSTPLGSSHAQDEPYSMRLRSHHA